MSRYVQVFVHQFRMLLHRDRGWVQTHSVNEIAFEKRLKNGNVIRVLTSIRNDNEECRGVGADAIRIVAFNPERDRGVAKTQRIYRVPGWQDRVKLKVTDVFEKVR